MMGCRMMLGVVVDKISLARSPHNIEVTLLFSIAHPVEAHVNVP
jgi:hypothetical protein